MSWCSLILVSVVLMHHGTLKPNPLDELTMNLNLNDATNEGPILESPGIESEEWKTGKTSNKDQRCHIGRQLPYKPAKKTRILDGKEVVPSVELPPWKDFIVSIKVDIGDLDGKHKLCGGALISRQHVLTALHCLLIPKKRLRNRPVGKVLVEPQKIEIFIKSLKFWEGESFRAHQIFFENMPEITFYDDHMCDLKDDIALIKLDREIAEGQVKPIPLPNKALETNKDDFLVAGWGATGTFPQWMFPTNLKFDSFLSSPCPREGILRPPKKYICLQQTNNGMVPGGQSKGICNGDSGSPGVTANPFPDPHKPNEAENPWFVQGITSRIIGGNGFCNDTTSLAANMDVFYYKEKIENWMNL